MKIKIAVARSRDRVAVCGPHDYDEADYHDAMSAALTWLAEAGEVVMATYWVTVELPVPSNEIKAEAESASNSI